MWKSLLFILLYFFASLVGAHSGRTDAYGGHNKTSDGTYHYHNSGTIGNGSGDWSIVTWLVLLFILFIIGSFIWAYFTEEENDRTPISNVRREDSNPASTTRSSDAKKRGESSTAARAARAAREASSSDAQSRGEKSTAAKAARAASSSDPKSRGQESTAVKAAKAASSTSTSASETEDLYFDNIKGSNKEKPSKDDSNEDDDLYFDNRVKK